MSLFSDCPNGFRAVHNKCYFWMEQDSFASQIKKCDTRSGKLLSTTFDSNDPEILVALKLMADTNTASANSGNKIYLGT